MARESKLKDHFQNSVRVIISLIVVAVTRLQDATSEETMSPVEA